MQIVGWDIGGAHLKAARMTETGHLLGIHQSACPLWRGLDQLEEALERLMIEASVSSEDRHVITMTGELADSFENRKAGVTGILNQCEKTFNTPHFTVFGGPKGFLHPSDIKDDDWAWIASANWLASGQWAATKFKDALFVDVGSTTADFLLLSDGNVQPRGYTDHARMTFDELIYSGITRTPIMALASKAPVLGAWSAPMAECFATTADIYRVTRELQEHTDQHPSADQGPKTWDASARRLGRQFGLDADDLTPARLEGLARYLREQQIQLLQNALMLQISRGLIPEEAPVIGAGIGRFLIQEIAKRNRRPFIDFKDLFEWEPCGTVFDAADCGPAAAVAALSLA